jgi:hypothetical protein
MHAKFKPTLLSLELYQFSRLSSMLRMFFNVLAVDFSLIFCCLVLCRIYGLYHVIFYASEPTYGTEGFIVNMDEKSLHHKF